MGALTTVAGPRTVEHSSTMLRTASNHLGIRLSFFHLSASSEKGILNVVCKHGSLNPVPRAKRPETNKFLSTHGFPVTFFFQSFANDGANSSCNKQCDPTSWRLDLSRLWKPKFCHSNSLQSMPRA